MKRKIILGMFIVFAIALIQFMFSNQVQASEYYNDEIRYYEYSKSITVYPAGKFIEKATIPSTINGKPVTCVDGFEDCLYLKTVTIPNTVTEISGSAFSGCKSLTTINIPSSVKEIGGYTFRNCESLKSINLPESIERIKWNAFEGCKSLTSIKIPSKVTCIDDETFEGCTSLKSITIPSNVTSIETSAFENCTGLTSITIPSTVTRLSGGWANGIFEGCTSLKTANIYASCSTIPEGLFKGCTSLTTVNFSNNFTKANDYVFYNCTALKTINLPINLTNISREMFYNCTSLTNVNIPDTVEEVSYSAFENCTSLKSIYLPVRTVKGGWTTGAFYNCKNLTTVYFNKKIQVIDEYAFKDVPASNLTFYGYPATAAKSYANENGFKYVECASVSSMNITGASSVILTKTTKLNVNISPSNAYNKNVKWTSSNSNVASVNYYTGVVTGKKVGTATITAQATDGTGVKATFKITVKPSDLPFVDVAINNWFYSSVKYTYTNKMIYGTDSTHFSPNNKLTRGMLVTILWRKEGEPKTTANKFTDVKSGKYYYTAVNWAASNGIVTGYGNKKFGPNDYITREQLCAILMNYANYKKKNTSERANMSKFKDYNKTSSYFKNAVSWCAAKKIISGKENGTKIDPKGNATRAEVAAMLMNYCNNVK